MNSDLIKKAYLDYQQNRVSPDSLITLRKTIHVKRRHSCGAGNMSLSRSYRVAGRRNGEDFLAENIFLKTPILTPTEASSIEEENEELEYVCLSFQREIAVYSKIIPAFQSLSGLADFPVPRLIGASANDLSGKSWLLLEDLSEVSSHPQRWLDQEEVCGVLRSLAKFHAGSFLYKHETGHSLLEMFPFLRDSAFEAKKHRLRLRYLKNVYKVLSWLGKFHLLQEKVKQVRDLLDSDPDEFIRAVHPLEEVEPYGVLVHDDLWTDNILFVNDSDACVFLDFALVEYGLPTDDIQYFMLYCLPALRYREEKTHYLDHYYDALKRTLQSSSAPVPFTREKLDVLMKRSLKRSIVRLFTELSAPSFDEDTFAAMYYFGLFDTLFYDGVL